MDYRGYQPSRDRQRRKRRARRRLLLLAVVVVIVFAIVLGVALVARGKKGGAPSSGGTPVAGRTASPTQSARPKPSPSATAPKVWLATKASPVRIWIGGDSLGGELGWALGPMFQKGKSFKPILFYKTSSGIARPDFFDWQREIEKVMRSAKPQAAVVMIGANDDQSINTGNGGWINYGTKAWKKTYQQRVSAMMTTMLEGGARRVYWVGMPVMAIGWRSARMKFIDSLVQQQAEKHPGVRYIDAWSMFSGPGDTFLPQWRIGDGVHFTGAGQQKLAETVYLAVLRDWKPTAAALHASPAPSPSSSASATP